MNLYRDEGSDAVYNAQRNLTGRTHYVDADTLRWHKSRVLSARVYADGLLFVIIESCALGMHNTRRGFRHVVFDVFGTVVDRVDLDHCVKTKAAAQKARDMFLATFDAKAHTLKAIDEQALRAAREYQEFLAKVRSM